MAVKISLLCLPSCASSSMAFCKASHTGCICCCSFLPLVVAQKKGFFDPENLQPELVQIRPAVAIPGLTLGSVDYTTVLGSTNKAPMVECVRAPPRVSLSIVCPVAPLTRFAPPSPMNEVPSTMMMMSESAGR